MTSRIAFAALLFAMGAYNIICGFVDSWEGAYCWNLGSPDYVRLPFWTAFTNAWNSLLSHAPIPSSGFALEVLSLTAFLWPVLAALISKNGFIRVSAFLLAAIPFALCVHNQIRVGFDAYCDGHGETALGFYAIQLVFVLPLGLILLGPAVWNSPKPKRPEAP